MSGAGDFRERYVLDIYLRKSLTDGRRIVTLNRYNYSYGGSAVRVKDGCPYGSLLKPNYGGYYNG